MKKVLCVILPALFSIHASATAIKLEQVKCVVDYGGSERVSLEVKRTVGSAPDQKMDYKGNKVAIGFSPGSEQEHQQVLTIELNGYQSRIVNPSQSLYMLAAPNNVRIQCYIAQ